LLSFLKLLFEISYFLFKALDLVLFFFDFVLLGLEVILGLIELSLQLFLLLLKLFDLLFEVLELIKRAGVLANRFFLFNDSRLLDLDLLLEFYFSVLLLFKVLLQLLDFVFQGLGVLAFLWLLLDYVGLLDDIGVGWRRWHHVRRGQARLRLQNWGWNRQTTVCN